MPTFTTLDELRKCQRRPTLVLTDGFEERVPVAAARAAELGISFQNVVLIKYPGAEHDQSYRTLEKMRTKLSSTARFDEIPPRVEDLKLALSHLDPASDIVVCDITGFSRTLIFRALTAIKNAGLQLFVLYTEAEHYYPLKKDFLPFLKESDADTAFMKLVQYEDSETVHSTSCVVEEIPEFPGEMVPSYPTMLIAFLAFKRSRLSAVLNQYETNARVLIGTSPVRPDLRWRRRALEIINFDLIADQEPFIHELPTLYWDSTYEFLRKLYEDEHNGYRYNILLAPLGGKMQTLGSWLFAIQYPDVKVVTSTPTKLYPKKYSRGFGETFLIKIPASLSELKRRPV